jgi:hypothetical protein
VPYLDNYWSDSFGPKCDPPVFGVLHFPKYFGNLSNFISHAIPKFQKTSVIDHGNTNLSTLNGNPLSSGNYILGSHHGPARYRANIMAWQTASTSGTMAWVIARESNTGAWQLAMKCVTSALATAMVCTLSNTGSCHV